MPKRTRRAATADRRDSPRIACSLEACIALKDKDDQESAFLSLSIGELGHGHTGLLVLADMLPRLRLVHLVDDDVLREREHIRYV